MNPEELANHPFDSSLHGYDKTQVREFLGQVGREFQAVLSRVTEAETRLGDLAQRLESADDLLRAADERFYMAQSRVTELEGENQELLSSREAPDEDVARHVGSEVTAVLQAAVAAGQTIRAEAEALAEQLRNDTIKELNERVSAARQEIDDLVAQEQERIQGLRSQEVALRAWMQDAQATFARLLEDTGAERRIREISEFPLPDVGPWSEDSRTSSF